MAGQHLAAGTKATAESGRTNHAKLNSSIVLCVQSSKERFFVVVFSLSEKKKKRKKLKSRKERNKHKVLLKLTHHKPQTNPLPTTQPPPPSLVETMKDLPSGNRRPSIESASFHYSHLEAARNGGIPIFIQERIQERQKRRGEVDSTERLSDKVMMM